MRRLVATARARAWQRGRDRRYRKASRVDQDTDPSTPEAKVASPHGHATTDPGIGPPSERPLPPPEAPLGIAVPPVKAEAEAKTDTVEALLEGIGGEQPARVKTTPQSEGQAAAAYHGEHAVNPARTDPDPSEPKVVVEKPRLAPTVRIDRSKLPEVPSIEGEVMSARAAMGEPRQAASDAAAPSPASRGRLVAAIAAGVVVVVASFFATRDRGPSESSAPPAPAATPTMARPHALWTIAPPALTATAAAAPPIAPPIVETTSLPAAGATVPPPSAKPAKPKPPAAASSGGDLGEFKTTFR